MASRNILILIAGEWTTKSQVSLSMARRLLGAPLQRLVVKKAGPSCCELEPKAARAAPPPAAIRRSPCRMQTSWERAGNRFEFSRGTSCFHRPPGAP